MFNISGDSVADKNGIKLILLDSYIKDGTYYWEFALMNDTDNDLYIEIPHNPENGSVYLDKGHQCGRRQKVTAVIKMNESDKPSEKDKISVDVTVLDITRTKSIIAFTVDLTFPS